MSEKASICLVVLVGVPGAGKTTFARCLKSYLRENGSGFTVNHVCVDELLPLEVQKRFAESTDDAVGWKETRREAVNEQITKLFAREGKIAAVIDDNNYYSSMRYEYYKMAKEHSMGFCQLHFSTEKLEDALESNARRPEGERVPEDVVRRMWSKLEPPKPLVNAWESFSFSVAANDANLEMCASVIKAAAENPVVQAPVPEERTAEARQESRATTSRNLLHQADRILRSLLGEKIQEEMRKENANLAAFGQRMNGVRSVMLSDLRTRKLVLPDDMVAAVESGSSESANALEDVLSGILTLRLQEEP